MNKFNHPPAGVLGTGMDVLSATGDVAASLVATRFSGASRRRMAFSAGLFAPLMDSLRGRDDWTGPWYKRGVTALKYLARALCMPIQHRRFLTFIDAHPSMQAYRRRDPRLLERHMHRYVNVRWGRRERLDFLSRHYRFALAHLPRELFDRVYGMGHASLGSLMAKDGSLLTLCLKPPIFKGCEGELCLQLCEGDDQPLYSIVFSVGGAGSSLVIGCLQGPRGEHARDRVRTLTRSLHGLRPKQLMLSLVYAFARHYGIRRLLAIGNDAHPLRCSGRPLYADYDAFWEEQQGEAIRGGWYALPSSLSCNTVADVPSQHRSAFRRREALRQQAETLLLHALGSPPLAGSTLPSSQLAGNDAPAYAARQVGLG